MDLVKQFFYIEKPVHNINIFFGHDVKHKVHSNFFEIC